MLSSSSKNSKAITAGQAITSASKWEALQVIISCKKRNMVKIPFYKSEAVSNSQVRFAMGESGRGKGEHATKKICNKTFGVSWNPKGHKPTGLLRYEDMTSKNKDETGYGYRTFTIFDTLDPLRNLKTISVRDYFGKWIEVPLSHMPDWPELSSSSISEFTKTFIECRTMGEIITIFDKKITYIKKKTDKVSGAIAPDGSSVRFIEPNEMVTKIVTKDGESIPSEKRTVKLMRLECIIPSVNIADHYPQWTDNKGLFNTTEYLPLYMAEIAKLKAEYVKKYSEIRPYEMGIIERAKLGETFPETVTVGGTVFEICIEDDTEYDMPKDTVEKLESGEYIQTQVLSTRGRWILEPAPALVEVK